MSLPSTLTLCADLQRRAVAHAVDVIDLDHVFKHDWPNQSSIMGRGTVHTSDVLALAGLACTSPDGKAMAARVVEDRWTEFIRSFAPNMQARTFLSVMRETDTTLVGGAAVEFVQEAPAWRLRDINFICGRDGFENFCIVLIEKLHGTVVRYHQRTDISSTHSCQAHCANDRCVIATEHAIFDVLRSGTVTPLTALAETYSTHLMISVSADTICMAYPSTFFDRVGMVRTGERSSCVERGIEKWRERGFVITAAVKDLDGRDIGGDGDSVGRCLRAYRFFGDEHCLTFYFRNALVSTGGDTVDTNNELKLAWTAGWIFGVQPCACDTCERMVPMLCESPWIADGAALV